MAITETLSRTGRWGRLTVNGVFIPITSWNAKLHKEFAVSTDSSNYDPSTMQLWRSRAPGELWAEFSFEANYDFGGTTDANFSANFVKDGPWPVILSFSPTQNFISCNADFDDAPNNLQVTVGPGAVMITFNVAGVSNGVVTVF